MIIIKKKRLFIMGMCVLLSLTVVGLNNIKKKETLPTMALPVSNKTVVIDARTWNAR